MVRKSYEIIGISLDVSWGAPTGPSQSDQEDHIFGIMHMQALPNREAPEDVLMKHT